MGSIFWITNGQRDQNSFISRTNNRIEVVFDHEGTIGLKYVLHVHTGTLYKTILYYSKELRQLRLTSIFLSISTSWIGLESCTSINSLVIRIIRYPNPPLGRSLHQTYKPIHFLISGCGVKEKNYYITIPPVCILPAFISSLLIGEDRYIFQYVLVVLCWLEMIMSKFSV